MTFKEDASRIRTGALPEIPINLTFKMVGRFFTGIQGLAPKIYDPVPTGSFSPYVDVPTTFTVVLRNNWLGYSNTVSASQRPSGMIYFFRAGVPRLDQF